LSNREKFGIRDATDALLPSMRATGALEWNVPIGERSAPRIARERSA
jgi:hypothetical protein